MKVTKEEIKRNYGQGSLSFPIVIPAGTRCKLITEGGTMGKYFIDDLSWLDRNHIVYHDAYYYGIVVGPEQVETP